jgi:hypothetical protein
LPPPFSEGILILFVVIQQIKNVIITHRLNLKEGLKGCAEGAVESEAF